MTKLYRRFLLYSLTTRIVLSVLFTCLIIGVTYPIESTLSNHLATVKRLDTRKLRPLITYRTQFLSSIANNKHQADEGVDFLSALAHCPVRINECDHGRKELSKLLLDQRLTRRADELDHICVTAEAASRRVAILVPPYTNLDWIPLDAEPRASDIRDFFKARYRFGDTVYRRSMRWIRAPMSRDYYFAQIALVQLEEENKLKEPFRKKIDTIKWWRDHALAIRLSRWGSILVLLSLVIFFSFFYGQPLPHILKKHLAPYGLDENEEILQELTTLWEEKWLNGFNQHQLESTLERDCRKLYRTRRAERNRLRNLELKKALPSSVVEQIETQVRKAENPRTTRRSHRTSQVHNLLELSQRVRRDHGLEAGKLVNEVVQEALVTTDKPKSKNKERLAALQKIRACSQELLGVEGLSKQDLILLAEHLRWIKRHLKKARSWNTFVENFDTEDPETYKPFIEAALQEDISLVQSLKPQPAPSLTDSQEDEMPLLLKGKYVLIVGGLQRLSKFYQEETKKLGAEKVAWIHHDQHSGGNLSPDIILYLFAHSSHSAYDRIKKLGKPIVLARKYQKSSYLSGLVQDLRLQL